jgi:hypothetical protein
VAARDCRRAVAERPTCYWSTAPLSGWYRRRVADLLEKNGHKVFSPTLTGLGERSHLLSKDINLDTHITDIVNV